MGGAAGGALEDGPHVAGGPHGEEPDVPGASGSMSCPQMALFSASQRCVRQRPAGARLVGEGGAWAASDVAPDQRTRLVTMRLREGRGSTHLARFLLAEEEDDEVSDRPSKKRRGWRQGENE